MKRKFFPFAVACFCFLITLGQVFAEPYVRIKPADNQPAETEVYGGEVAPLTKLIMEPVTLNEDKPAMLQYMSVQVEGIGPAVNMVVLILNKSKSVDDIEEGRIVAYGFYSGSEFVSLNPTEGQNIIHFRDRIKMTVSVVMDPYLTDYYLGQELSADVTGIYATWVNGSATRVKGFLPIIGQSKKIKSDAAIGIGTISELQLSSYGALKYEVPADSVEDVFIKKIFINGKRKKLKLLVEASDGQSREFKCKSNSEVTVCDFDGEGLLMPKGSSVVITASEQNVFFMGYDPKQIFCEGAETGRRIFITSFYSNGKG